MIAVHEAAAPQDDARRLARRVALWLVPFAVLGVALAFVFPDSYQQDGGHHFLGARWGFVHPRNLVGVWNRPLFTTLYALPAQLGYPAAKLLTVAVSLAAAWHTAWLAHAHGLRRAELAVPLLFLQPSFLLLCSETMTEPLFALLLAVALRLHQAGRVHAGMWVAGLLPLVRPEGFFVGVLWGVFVLFHAGAGRNVLARAVAALQLAGGTAAWWLAALAITGDPLFILHDWPTNWGSSYSYGTGPLWHYVNTRHQILAGPAMYALFVLGFAALILRRRAGLAVASLALVAGMHSIFFRLEMFGSAGYARYLVCVAAPIALAALAGWNLAAGWLARRPVLARAAPVLGALALAYATVHCLTYVDAFGTSRDARAVQDMYEWFQANPRPVKKLVFSQAYMSILFDRDPWERPRLGDDPQKAEAALRKQPPGTLVFWDARTGRQFHGMGAAEIERAGYELLRAQRYKLRPFLPYHLPWVENYEQELFLFYKR
ncbi:MAG TPA: hypothetical protein VEB43_14770 [Anaeromyxobacter sp.]|nr:hypothetical protein [Anaeromyxobacter sp.]